jgi:signal transduction histidine kinase
MRSLPFKFGLALAALVSAVVLGVVNTRADLQTLQTASQDSVFWSAAQLEHDYGALQVDVARQALIGDIPSSAVRERFESLRSHAENFRLTQMTEHLLSDPKVHDVHIGLETLLTELNPIITALPDGKSSQLVDVTNKLHSFEPEIRASTVSLLNADRARIAGIRDSIREGMMLTAAALALTLIVAMALTFLAIREANKSAALAVAATTADTSRKRFFTMMSHELRTPLNGILGSLALIREESDNKTRQALLDEAHASAHRLSNLVNDTVDLNEDENLEIQPTLFRISDFIDSVEAFLAPQLRRRNADLRITVETKTKAFLRCDSRRLTNALSYIINNALQRGGARQVHLVIDLNDDKLSVEIGTDVMLPHDAFGETLARGIIERLGGSVVPRETKRVVTVPVELITLSAKLSFSSKALLRMYEALLNANGIAVTVNDSTDQPVNILLAEAAQETVSFSELRMRNPNAVLIACGVGGPTSTFDEVAKTPDDLMRAIQSALGHRASPEMDLAA